MPPTVFNEADFLEDLDNISTQHGFSLLLQGPHGSGKTHFLGDALRYEQEQGTVRYMSFPEEDGFRTIANLGLGKCMFKPKDAENIERFCHYWREQGGLRLLAVDAVHFLQEMSMHRTLKADRMPVIEGKKNEWPQVHTDFHNLVTLIKSVSTYTVFTVPSDIETINEWDGSDKHRIWTPDLAGKPSRRMVGWVDYCFALRTVQGATSQVRNLMTQSDERFTNRQRLPNGGIKTNLKLPNGYGGWKMLIDAIDDAYQRKGNS